MRVKMRVQMTGTRNGVHWPAKGECLEVPDLEGGELCAAGLAEPCAVKPVERAEKRTMSPAPKAKK